MLSDKCGAVSVRNKPALQTMRFIEGNNIASAMDDFNLFSIENRIVRETLLVIPFFRKIKIG
jgi:hypothetical protein